MLHDTSSHQQHKWINKDFQYQKDIKISRAAVLLE